MIENREGFTLVSCNTFRRDDGQLNNSTQQGRVREYDFTPHSWWLHAVPDDPLQPAQRLYGIGNPMPMIMREAPGAGIDAHTVWEQGKPTEEPLLSPFETVTSIDKAVRNTFAFVQVSGKAAGEEQVANISMGLTWDRQSPIEDCAREVVKTIGGEHTRLFWFGPHKLIGIVETDQTPYETMERFVHAPRKPYEKYLPHLAVVQNSIQNIREQDILLDKGLRFVRHFYGEDDRFERAHQNDGGMSFEWLYVNRGNELWGINLDHQPQSLPSIALSEYTDKDTGNMLLAMQEFFQGSSSQNRYFIEFNFGEDVTCCNVSSNAQYSHASGNVFETEIGPLKGFGMLSHMQSIQIINESLKTESYCKACNNEESKCQCGQEETVAQAA